MRNSLGIQKALPTGLLTKLEMVQTPDGQLTILTVFCNQQQTSEIISQATKIRMPHERFKGGVKLFN